MNAFFRALPAAQWLLRINLWISLDRINENVEATCLMKQLNRKLYVQFAALFLSCIPLWFVEECFVKILRFFKLSLLFVCPWSVTCWCLNISVMFNARNALMKINRRMTSRLAIFHIILLPLLASTRTKILQKNVAKLKETEISNSFSNH